MPDKRAEPDSKRSALRALVGTLAILAYLALIEWAWGWHRIFEQWQSWSLQATFACFAAMFLTYGLRALRIQDFYRHRAGAGFATCLRITLFHNLANNLLPMRSGEASFPLLIRAWFGVSATEASGTLLLFRLLDLYSLALICLAGWCWLEQHYVLLVLALAIALALPLMLFPARPHLQRLFGEGDNRLSRLLQGLLRGTPSKAVDLLRCQLISLLNWAVKVVLFAWILISFGGLAGFQAILGALGGELSSILPFHAPAGVGTYEAGVVAGAMLAGAEPGVTLGAAVNLHILIILGTLLGGLLATMLPSTKPPGAMPEG